MFKRTVSPDDLARLKAQREEIDRRYNEALTVLDGSILHPPDVPSPPPAPDEYQVTPLNEGWDLLAAPPDLGTGWRGRLATFVWRLVEPVLQRQRTFNAALVDHVNRNVAAHRGAPRAISSLVGILQDQVRHLAAFESSLIIYLQQVTPYVDSKDYEFAGLAKRLHEDSRELIARLDHRSVALAGAISGVGDELAKRWESMSGLAAVHDELRQSLALLQLAVQGLKREIQRLGPGAAVVPSGAAPSGAAAATGTGSSGTFQQAQATTLDSYKYVGFENRFRGSPEDIRGRLAEYLPYFEGRADVLDVGCGRGEFLDLLAEAGISCRGLDLNSEMVQTCRARGLSVEQGDALGYLRGLPDSSLGGLLAAQVVEHLQPDYLLALLDAAYDKLRPGSPMILETINPACWFAFFASYIRDITHVRPVHPETLAYFVQASGFQRVTIRYRAPYPEHEKLRPVPGLDEVSQTLNANTEKLNQLMFTHMDYAVIGERM